MTIAIHWFRHDLRLSDNPALTQAARFGQVMPIYVLDDESAGADQMGAASRVWLHHSLAALDQTLGGNLRVFRGDARVLIPQLVQQYNAKAVFWNRCYEPWRMARDEEIKSTLKAGRIEVESFNGALLWEPWEVKKADGTPYRVFTPFFRKGCLSAPEPRKPLAVPDLSLVQGEGCKLDRLRLLPRIRWDKDVAAHWSMGEKAAQNALAQFVEYGLSDYKQGRNFPARACISRLSPYLHFGALSPNQAWWAVQGHDENSDCFRSELGWREFSHSLAFHFPELRRENWNNKFNAFPWVDDQNALTAWQLGQTGIPFIDAGLRELWQTGYMHNRVRMVVASFLIKNLRIDWRQGEAWFWDTLFDADYANNAAGWQWVAGSGADAAPYFRVFNPVTQGQKFDPDGQYVRRFVPEIGALETRYLHAPWEAPQALLDQAGIILGQNYPRPMVDLKLSRALALEAYQALGQSDDDEARHSG